MKIEKQNLDNIFSIDIESHLKKLAAYSYLSIYHFPVELVRLAFQRGATRTDVFTKSDRIIIQDNGKGMNINTIKMLYLLLDPNQPVILKEKIIFKLQNYQGIGILGIFAPSPKQIIIENVSQHQKHRLLYQNDTIRIFPNCSIESGTRITIYRKGQNITQEKVILKKYCQAVQKSIYLDSFLRQLLFMQKSSRLKSLLAVSQ